MSPPRLPKMMIGFVVRRCTVALGRVPSPAEFALWANTQGTPPNTVCLFGRPISDREAAVILRHQARLVSARSAAPEEEYKELESLLQARPANGARVIPLDRARMRPNGRHSGRGRRSNGRGPLGAR